MSALLYNICFIEQTQAVFSESYQPTKLQISTQKGFIEQKKFRSQLEEAGRGSWIVRTTLSIELRHTIIEESCLGSVLFQVHTINIWVLSVALKSQQLNIVSVSRTIKISYGHHDNVPTNNQRVPPLIVTNYIFISLTVTAPLSPGNTTPTSTPRSGMFNVISSTWTCTSDWGQFGGKRFSNLQGDKSSCLTNGLVIRMITTPPSHTLQGCNLSRRF